MTINKVKVSTLVLTNQWLFKEPIYIIYIQSVELSHFCLSQVL